MSNPNEQCPHDDIVRFAHGTLPEEDLERVVAHIEKCEECADEYRFVIGLRALMISESGLSFGIAEAAQLLSKPSEGVEPSRPLLLLDGKVIRVSQLVKREWEDRTVHLIERREGDLEILVTGLAPQEVISMATRTQLPHERTEEGWVYRIGTNDTLVVQWADGRACQVET